MENSGNDYTLLAVLTPIITALITAGLTFLGTVITVRKKSQADEVKAAEREARQDEKLKMIEKKIDIHNGYAKRFESVDNKLSETNTKLALVAKDVEYIKKGQERR